MRLIRRRGSAGGIEMGEIRRGICPQCGYEKELHVGAGIAAINVSMIEGLFPAEIMAEFKAKKAAGEVKGFLLEQVPAMCGECKELLTVPFFHYELTNGEKKKYLMACSKCARPVEVLGAGAVSCPKCGAEMEFLPGGDWD